MIELAFKGNNPKIHFSREVPKDGLHILSNFYSSLTLLLKHHVKFHQFIDQEIAKLKLNKVGEAYHDFEGGGFTGVVCLAESHLSIHTWPDRNYVTFDVYLSNYTCDNSSKATALYKSVIDFFEATVVFEESVKR